MVLLGLLYGKGRDGVLVLYLHIAFKLIIPSQVVSIALHWHVIDAEQAIEFDSISFLKLLLVCFLHVMYKTPLSFSLKQILMNNTKGHFLSSFFSTLWTIELCNMRSQLVDQIMSTSKSNSCSSYTLALYTALMQSTIIKAWACIVYQTIHEILHSSRCWECSRHRILLDELY